MKPLFELPELLTLDGNPFYGEAANELKNGHGCSVGCEIGCCAGCDKGSGSGPDPIIPQI